MNRDIRTMLKAWTAAFNVSRTNPDESFKASRYVLRKSIRDAKIQRHIQQCPLKPSSQTCLTHSMLPSRQTIPSHPGRDSLLQTTRCFYTLRLPWVKLSKAWILT
jgi:hypothetical protein